MIDDKPLDFTDPATLANECSVLAQGMDQQAQASRGGTALGGAPYPEQFYMRCANIFRACEAAFKQQTAVKPPEIPTPPTDTKKKP